MPADNTGLLLKQLFEQTDKNHQRNVDDGNRRAALLETIKDDVADIKKDAALHGQRLSLLEAWRLIEADPTIQRVKSAEAQIKGGWRVMRIVGPAGYTIGGGAVAAFCKPLLLFIGILH